MNTTDRREFLKLSACAAAGAALPGLGADLPKLGDIRALLLHLGHNMWCDWFPADVDSAACQNAPKPDTKLRNRDDLWRKTTDYAVKKGVNMIVFDVGEGVVYPSHPELAIDGSWSPDKLRAEVRRLRAMGVEAIPKLNFSTSHNGWLKQYRRMVSTPTYYKVCEDVLRDVYEIFDRPRFIHIGCDEESASHQINILHYSYIVARTHEFWIHDYLHLVRTVESLGARPWCWSDYGWRHPEFLKRSPKSVVMSNWYYVREVRRVRPEDEQDERLGAPRAVLGPREGWLRPDSVRYELGRRRTAQPEDRRGRRDGQACEEMSRGHRAGASAWVPDGTMGVPEGRRGVQAQPARNRYL